MKIDFSEQFPKLAHPPIVEAVLDFRVLPSIPVGQALFESYFKSEFEGFPTIQVQNLHNYRLDAGVDGQMQPAQAISVWHGLAFHSSDKLRIAQCQKDGFSFSRLEPYGEWETFTSEALLLWQKYARLIKPSEIQRLSVRFINRIEIDEQPAKLSDYLIDGVGSLASLKLPLASFLHENAFLVPEYNYLINLNLALQPPLAPDAAPAIIVDINVSTTRAMPLSTDVLAARLNEMRWLKNKFFFASITPKVIASLA